LKIGTALIRNLRDVEDQAEVTIFLNPGFYHGSFAALFQLFLLKKSQQRNTIPIL